MKIPGWVLHWSSSQHHYSTYLDILKKDAGDHIRADHMEKTVMTGGINGGLILHTHYWRRLLELINKFNVWANENEKKKSKFVRFSTVSCTRCCFATLAIWGTLLISCISFIQLTVTQGRKKEEKKTHLLYSAHTGFSLVFPDWALVFAQCIILPCLLAMLRPSGAIRDLDNAAGLEVSEWTSGLMWVFRLAMVVHSLNHHGYFSWTPNLPWSMLTSENRIKTC